MTIHDTRARHRGFSDAGQYLTMALRALDAPTKTPRWVWREYRAIYEGEMWRRQSDGGIEEER